jgi:RNA 2',3'-cyclic 3'-phosphodiesterase
MEDIRAFIAIELPEETRAKLRELEEKLKTSRLKARWVDPNSIHLTLKFLGNISRPTVDNIKEVMELAAVDMPAFRIGVGGVGVFPNKYRVQVIWAGVNGEIDKLVELQKRIDSGLTEFGFAPESRPFTAHLTLARMRDEASAAKREAAGKLAEAVQFAAPEFAVTSFNLMQSQLTREGPVYSRLLSIPLVQ